MLLDLIICFNYSSVSGNGYMFSMLLYQLNATYYYIVCFINYLPFGRYFDLNLNVI